MLPLYLLTNARGQIMRIELKNGETVEGTLSDVDNWMNLMLSDVTHVASGETLKLPSFYLKGSFIKYINLQDDVIDKVKQQWGQNRGGKDDRRRGGNNYNNGSNFHQNRDGGNRRGGRRNYQNSGSRRDYNNNGKNNNSNTNGGGSRRYNKSQYDPATSDANSQQPKQQQQHPQF
ncbi:U6 snRNA-associated Sm-like protein LSm4 [Kluyveromyces marxianus]